MIRKLIPKEIKRQIRLVQRKTSDKKKGIDLKFVQKNQNHDVESLTFPISEIRQPIFYNPLSANKVDNIRLAIKEISAVSIAPGNIFSFWYLLGNPTQKKGYKKGRNIIGDSLQEDIGGGLCQVSGMLYHLALVSGLEILERHNHTLDLYEEDKRYTPLGADATVVYGYKDFRFKNNFDVPIRLTFEVDQISFIGHLLAGSALPKCNVRFDRKDYPNKRTIETYRAIENQQEVFINQSTYLLP